MRMPARVFRTCTAAEVVFANPARLMLDPEDWPAERVRCLEHDARVTLYERGRRYGTNFFDRTPPIDLRAGPR